MRSATRFFEYDGTPIIWEAGKPPRFVPSGIVIHNFESLLRMARQLTSAEFQHLLAILEESAREREGKGGSRTPARSTPGPARAGRSTASGNHRPTNA